MQSGERTEPAEGSAANNGDNNNAEQTAAPAPSHALNLNSPSYNTRNPAVRRLLHEARELQNPTDQFWAHPLEDNLFEWHFTIAGPSGCEFEGGIYHGRIILPANYPLQPPSFILVTPNGRFETNRKICLSISGHHPESWQPSWSIRTALVALIAFLPTPGAGALGSLDYPVEERKRLAAKSRTFSCPDCGAVSGHLAKPCVSPPSTSANNGEAEKSPEQQTESKPNEPSEAVKGEVAPPQSIETSSQSELSFFPSFAANGPTQTPPVAAAVEGGAQMVTMPPPPYVAATYLPYLYQSMFTYASYYAHQAATAAVIAGAIQHRQLGTTGVEGQRQQQPAQQNLTPADLIAQQQYRERRASAFLFAVILLAWTITRFLDRFVI